MAEAIKEYLIQKDHKNIKYSVGWARKFSGRYIRMLDKGDEGR